MNIPKFIFLLIVIVMTWLLIVMGIAKWYGWDKELPSTSNKEVFKDH
ncbi:hypothetical protein PS862_00756 [Pseudomonas fluorescens]|uniref:Uncharacterized protein n=1 Tax=Pseudomonas fluorescens TaxID=294 RepID=A0A5E7H992_PSEFL|nr:hypothetical protein PS639_02002 [Pseudomonas fluorescens]VVO59812.1 hypothetical protein PS862_00756 [Pseudomonas fluorescens]